MRLMFEVADQMISDRRRNPQPGGPARTSWTRCSRAADPETGERLSDENVRYQMVTFLIAGHETTSGLLSFTLYELLRHPDVLAKARAEVDEVLGTESAAVRAPAAAGLPGPDPQGVAAAVADRAGVRAALPHEDTMLGGRYEIRRGPASWC